MEKASKVLKSTATKRSNKVMGCLSRIFTTACKIMSHTCLKLESRWVNIFIFQFFPNVFRRLEFAQDGMVEVLWSGYTEMYSCSILWLVLLMFRKLFTRYIWMQYREDSFVRDAIDVVWSNSNSKRASVGANFLCMDATDVVQTK